jgi:hypothetical protein
LDHGIFLNNDANVNVTGNYIYKNKLAAISLGGAINAFEDVLIEGNTFDSNNQANSSSVGIIYAIGNVSDVKITGNRFVDRQVSPTMQYPIYTGPGTFTRWNVNDNTYYGQTNPQTVFWDTTTPAVWSKSIFEITQEIQTTNATSVYVAIAPVANNTACVLRTTALAVQSDGSNRAYYDKENAMFRAGGALTALGPIVTYYEQESDATWGGFSPSQTGNVALASIDGKAATTINWSYTYRMVWK